MERGDPDAAAALFAAVFDELLRRAEAALRKLARSHTLQPGDLVSLLFLRLFGRRIHWVDRHRFFAYAMRTIDSILRDHQRGKRRGKRSPPGERVPLERVEAARYLRAALPDFADPDVLDAALRALGRTDPDAAKIARLVIDGKSRPAIAKRLGLSLRTVERRWTFAKAWLRKHLGDADA